MNFIKLIKIALYLSADKLVVFSFPSAYANTIAPSVISNFESYSSTSFSLKWSQPSYGIVNWYEVQYAVSINFSQALNFSAIASETVNVTGSSTEFNLTNLQKWTCYEVQIRAAITYQNVFGYTTFGAAKRKKTLEDGKSLPTSVGWPGRLF